MRWPALVVTAGCDTYGGSERRFEGEFEEVGHGTGDRCWMGQEGEPHLCSRSSQRVFSGTEKDETTTVPTVKKAAKKNAVCRDYEFEDGDPVACEVWGRQDEPTWEPYEGHNRPAVSRPISSLQVAVRGATGIPFQLLGLCPFSLQRLDQVQSVRDRFSPSLVIEKVGRPKWSPKIVEDTSVEPRTPKLLRQSTSRSSLNRHSERQKNQRASKPQQSRRQDKSTNTTATPKLPPPRQPTTATRTPYSVPSHESREPPPPQ
ncbi:hypothetical protein BKA80DRAFT_308844 [Phyllosticta citrichinensis]